MTAEQKKSVAEYQITNWIHRLVKEHVKPGDFCIDATIGNGNDTALLSELSGENGKVLGFDIQELALSHTKDHLKRQGCPENYELYCVSHEKMGEYAKEESVSCMMFNFGYLPGGDHKMATKAKSSIQAIDAGLKLLKIGGLMTLCIYSGGDSGFEEKEALLTYLKSLDAKRYLVILSQYYNRPNHPPIPVLIIKQK